MTEFKYLRLKPHIVQKIWGGQKLKTMRPTEEGLENPIGETWEVSRLEEGPTETGLGSLHSLCSEKELPYLVKFIDTNDNLSIQVHPDNDYALKNENSSGKTECWIILDSAPGAGIYLGFKKGVTKEKFQKSVESGEDVNNLLNFYETKKGDFFMVPAGAIHAIGKGVTLVEIQQSSGITYRVWDWNRLDSAGNSRELHIKKAMDVCCFDEEFNTRETFKMQRDILSRSGTTLIASHEDFNVWISNGGWDSSKIETKGRCPSIVSLGSAVNLGELEIGSWDSCLFKTLPGMLESNKPILVVN
ncbi:MAG: class I mannose-6-phosphate isomerase [Bacteriovoracaceae bacterium]|nr:class I mannose-6-phosphate isomerase [Bacteriovoracaceae bacterium]